MQGTPAEPKCGFSRRVVGALWEQDVPFQTFDILSDESIRQVGVICVLHPPDLNNVHAHVCSRRVTAQNHSGGSSSVQQQRVLGEANAELLWQQLQASNAL